MNRMKALFRLALVALVVILLIAGPVEARGGGRGGRGSSTETLVLGFSAWCLLSIRTMLWRLTIRWKAWRAATAAKRLSRSDSSWSPDALKNRIRDIYFGVQRAWGNGDMTPAEELMTPALCLDWQQILLKNRSVHRQNICREIELKSMEIVGLTDLPFEQHDRVVVLITGSMIDYLIDSRTGKLIDRNEFERGTLPMPQAFTELWTLSRRDSSWVLREATEDFDLGKVFFQPIQYKDNTYGSGSQRSHRRS